ncbi:hypothetical protein TSOC_012648 [Tetrabaena socialis]|uniref:Non-reducing end beta-L-arabinofuranosidase-like GH127 catalytic domain-containing protein n=1 Tax=Tetrabaena socialis TaxID=47790 RepID=A0A2J7ZMG4_9CHLO|nr:hypothetical protein TSOC_012648 [Tetrabaena socialis]|eukprot:PNH01464.1 hypothetical protein TSOC_012648 [Tetrabaena socialis]
MLFWSINPDGNTEDYHASHTGCPVLAGVKWTATKWIHAKPFRPAEMASGRHVPYVQDPGRCTDDSSSCREWAAMGNCEKLLYRLYRLTRDPDHLAFARLFDKPYFREPMTAGSDTLQGLHANTHMAQVGAGGGGNRRSNAKGHTR